MKTKQRIAAILNLCGLAVFGAAVASPPAHAATGDLSTTISGVGQTTQVKTDVLVDAGADQKFTGFAYGFGSVMVAVDNLTDKPATVTENGTTIGVVPAMSSATLDAQVSSLDTIDVTVPAGS